MQVSSAKGVEIYGAMKRISSEVVWNSDKSQTGSGSNAAIQDSVTLSPQARELAATQTVSPVYSDETALFDTNKGSVELGIDAYFSPNQEVVSGGIESLPPLLLPTENNINVLAKHISKVLPGLMSDYGIPVAPDTIQYDNRGELILPDDYQYSEEFTQMLDENPTLAKEMSTVNALSSHLAGIQRALAFQEESEGMSEDEIDLLMAKYSDLFDGRHSAGDFSLGFTPDGSLNVNINGESIA